MWPAGQQLSFRCWWWFNTLYFPIVIYFYFLKSNRTPSPPPSFMSKSLASSLLPPPSSCKTCSVCVKIFPLCHLQRPRQCPLSSHSSNYPSVGPGRQMLSEPSSIRHSAAAWHTQYDTKKEREKNPTTIALCTVT